MEIIKNTNFATVANRAISLITNREWCDSLTVVKNVNIVVPFDMVEQVKVINGGTFLHVVPGFGGHIVTVEQLTQRYVSEHVQVATTQQSRSYTLIHDPNGTYKDEECMEIDTFEINGMMTAHVIGDNYYEFADAFWHSVQMLQLYEGIKVAIHGNFLVTDSEFYISVQLNSISRGKQLVISYGDINFTELYRLREIKGVRL